MKMYVYVLVYAQMPLTLHMDIYFICKCIWYMYIIFIGAITENWIISLKTHASLWAVLLS